MKKTIPILISIVFLGILGTLYWVVGVMKSVFPRPMTYIFSEKGSEIITKIPNEYGWFEPYTGSLNAEFISALIEIEDKRYYEHHGVDIVAKIGAIWDNMKSGTIIRGGSTITEQYIKNHYFPEANRTYLQKIKEALLALSLSIGKDKETMLRQYLDSLYFGNRIYGIKTALHSYFSKDTMEDLTREEITLLLALVKYPSISTLQNNEWADYRKTIENRLGWGSTSGSTIYFQPPTPGNTYPLLTTRIIVEYKNYCDKFPNSLTYFVENIDTVDCNSGKIQLSIDGKLQKFVENSVRGTLTPLAEHNVTNAAVLVLDPQRGKYLAYVGNRSALGNGSDIDIIKRRRSVGSILKPFLYLEALKKGGELDTLILDDESIYSTEYKDKVFVPRNYDLKIFGPVRLAEALASSLNLASVRLTEALGLENIYRSFKNYGLNLDKESSYYGYGIILGGVELTLENVVNSYTQLLPSPGDKDLFLLYHILSSNEYRSKSFGYNSILATSIPMAVKTGTSTDFKDNWTISYHKDAIIGVWVGNLDNSSMLEVSGITGAGPVWKSVVEYMIQAQMMKDAKLTIPQGVLSSYLCLDTRCLRKTKTYKKSDKEYKSRILDKVFYSSDFFTPPTIEEREQWNITNE